MTRFLPIALFLLLHPCHEADRDPVGHHLEQLCQQQEVREEYLDFYWDDLRTHQPELWAQALATCTESCPDAVNCGPVLSVASWYQQPVATKHP